VTDTDGSREFRALFISDVHLGTRGCQAERLLDFLRLYDGETIYLVGDIIDGWALRSGWYWPQPHNDVVQKLLRKARKGARVIYVPGNHDEVLRGFYGTHFGGIEVVREAIHAGPDGRRWGRNSSHTSPARTTPRTYRHPPIASRGNMNLHSEQRASGLVADR